MGTSITTKFEPPGLDPSEYGCASLWGQRQGVTYSLGVGTAAGIQGDAASVAGEGVWDSLTVVAYPCSDPAPDNPYENPPVTNPPGGGNPPGDGGNPPGGGGGGGGGGGNPPIYIPPSGGGGDGGLGDDELAEILGVLVAGFAAIELQLKTIISNQGNGEPGGTSCCTNIVAAIAAISQSLGLLTQAVGSGFQSVGGGGVNLNPIVNAINAIAQLGQGLPQLLPLLLAYFANPGPGGAPVDLSAILAQLTRMANDMDPNVADSADADALTAWVISQPAYPPEAAQALDGQADAD